MMAELASFNAFETQIEAVGCVCYSSTPELRWVAPSPVNRLAKFLLFTSTISWRSVRKK